MLTHRAILKAIWGPNAVEQPEHLWTLVAQLRKKIEPDPAQPRYLLSEPWVGYRFATGEPRHLISRVRHVPDTATRFRVSPTPSQPALTAEFPGVPSTAGRDAAGSLRTFSGTSWPSPQAGLSILEVRVGGHQLRGVPCWIPRSSLSSVLFFAVSIGYVAACDRLMK